MRLQRAFEARTVELVAEKEGEGALCGVEEVLGRVGDRVVDGEGGVEALSIRACLEIAWLESQPMHRL